MDRRIARVTEVRILDHHSVATPEVATQESAMAHDPAAEAAAPDLAVLAVTARRGGDEVTRTLSAPPATIRHAAMALARHYGLHSAGTDRWRSGAGLTR